MKEVRTRAQFPAKFKCLFEPATPEHGRYNVFYGGRGSMKSWTVARALLTLGVNKVRRDPLLLGETEDSPISFRVWCAREIQNSIEESVYHLLKSQIRLMGMQDFYDVQKTKIVGKPGTSAEGTEFLFYGLHYNIEERKSMENVDVMWIEEGNKVSGYSFEVIIPTIRKEYADGTCSKIIITFNPELDDDEAYRRFVKPQNRPRNAIVIEVSFRDNPWFPRVLEVERQELLRLDPDAYQTVYEGKTRVTLQGAVFAKELRDARSKNRICQFEVVRGNPVNTFWDLGRADMTAIWFVQRVALQWRVLDFYQNNQEHIDHFLLVLQNKANLHGYVYGTHFLPHDAKAKQLGSKRTVEEQVRGEDPDTQQPLRSVRIVPAHKLTDQINAARSIFPNCYFKEDTTSGGLAILARYCYEVDPQTKQFSQKPLHDQNSHCASAWMQFAIAAREPERLKRQQVQTTAQQVAAVMGHPQGWLANA